MNLRSFRGVALPSFRPFSSFRANRFENTFRRASRLLLSAVLSVALLSASLFGAIAPAHAGLPPGNAVTDGAALLRYSLPIDSPEIRKIQGELEGLSQWLRSKRWGPIKKDLKKVDKLITRKRDAILDAVPADRKGQAGELLDSIAAGIEPAVALAEEKDQEGVWVARKALLDQVGELEELMVKGYPFEVPEEYDNLPQLKGRATVQFTTTKGDVTVIADGYSAPVTAGNFIDLVDKGFYNDMPFIRAEDFYVLQTGDPKGPEEGYIDPKTKEYRAIPMEILVKDDDAPTYGVTLEEIGRYMDEPVLPFNSYGSLALARPGNDNNGGSSQFFFFLFEAELTPAGRNMLDGRYAVFGYTVDGKEVLRNLSAEDEIVSAKVIDGMENLQRPKA